MAGSERHHLRGGCQCGRNRYIIQFPADAASRRAARVLFDAQPTHRSALANPLSAFLRVPLSWYHNFALAAHPDETNSLIHRVYTSPHEQHAKRHFCGFCGTPLSYWSEEPRSEADFIRLTLGSLSPQDLADLDDLGLLSGESDDEREDSPVRQQQKEEHPEEEEQHGSAERGVGTALLAAHRAAALVLLAPSAVGVVGGLPWLDALMEGSRLGGTLRTARGRATARDGTLRVEWEISEWTEDDDEPESPRKRKLDELETPSGEMMGIDG